MISSCPCFCFALGFEAIILAFWSRCVNFYLRLLLCTGRGQAISQYRHLYPTLETFLPTVIHWPRQHRDRSQPGHKHRAHVSCENTSDESFIFMVTSQVLWNISNSLETYYSSHSRKFSSPSACQFSSAGLGSHPPWPQSPNKGALILLRLFFTGQGFLSNFNFHWLQN